MHQAMVAAADSSRIVPMGEARCVHQGFFMGEGFPARFGARGFFLRSARALHGIEICQREPLNTTPLFCEAL